MATQGLVTQQRAPHLVQTNPDLSSVVMVWELCKSSGFNPSMPPEDSAIRPRPRRVSPPCVPPPRATARVPAAHSVDSCLNGPQAQAQPVGDLLIRSVLAAEEKTLDRIE